MGGSWLYLETEETTIVAQSCGKCGVVFGLGEKFKKERMNDHQTWYCPNGHPRVFNGKSEETKQRERAERAEREAKAARAGLKAALDQAEAAELSRRAVKGHNTRLRNKIARGECPCCGQSFPDVATHMAAEHPNFQVEEVPGEH